MRGTPVTRRVKVFAVAVGLTVAIAAGAVAAQQLSFFYIISNPPGSRPCDKGGSCGVPGLIAVAQSTEGSVDNINAIARDEIESGLSQSDIAYWAYTGTGVYALRGPITNISLIANLYPESIQIVVRRDSGIATVPDLRGKRISLGAPESGTLVDAKIILAAYGLEEDDIIPVFEAPGPAGDLMRDGKLDAFFIVAGVPTNAIEALSEEIEIDLLPIDGEIAARLIEENPFFAVNVIPAETYVGTPEIHTLSVGAQWIVGTEVDADLVYGVTRALWNKNSREVLDNGHPKGAQIRLETALKGAGLPLHPGAERYYREQGLID
jgi:TRAP transporter TAXI family solute receptor